MTTGSPVDWPVSSPVAISRRLVLKSLLLVSLFVVIETLVNAVTGEKILFLFKEQLHLSATSVTLLNILLAIPLYIQPLLGAWTETTSWLGYHRRSYFCLGVVLCSLGYGLLALLPHYTYAAILGLMLIKGIGVSLLVVIYWAVRVEVGIQTGTFTRMQSVAIFLPLVLASVYTSHLGGYVAAHWTYPHTFATAARLTLCWLPLVLLLDEKKTEENRKEENRKEEFAQATQEKRRRKELEENREERYSSSPPVSNPLQGRRAAKQAFLRQALRSRGLWIVVAFFAFIAITPSPETAKTYYLADALHLPKQEIGDLGKYQAVGTLLGLLILTLMLHKIQVRFLAFGYALSNCLLYLCYLLIHDPLSAKIGVFLFGFVLAASMLLSATLQARACPPGVEATVWGIFASCIRFFYLGCDLWGSWMYDFLGPSNKAHHYTIAHGWYISNWVGLAVALFAFLFLPFFPDWTRSTGSI